MAASVKAITAFVSGLLLSLTGGGYYFMYAQRGTEPAVLAQQESHSARKAQPEITAEAGRVGISEASLASKSTPAKRSHTEILPKPGASRSRSSDRAKKLSMLRPPDPQRSSAPILQASPPPAIPPQAHTITIPAGTIIAVRLMEALSNRCNYIGDTFGAVLDHPIVIDGVTIAERGAKVSGTIIKWQAGGRLGAAAELRLTLTEISTTEGESLHIATNQYLRATSCSTRLSATTVGDRAISGNISAISDRTRQGGGNEESVLTGVDAVGVESATTTYEKRLIFTLASAVTVRGMSGVGRSK